MARSVTSTADAKLAVARDKAKAMTEYGKEQREVAKRTAKLRELRLARDAAEKQAAVEAAAAKPAKKKAKAKKAPAEKPPKRTTRTY